MLKIMSSLSTTRRCLFTDQSVTPSSKHICRYINTSEKKNPHGEICVIYDGQQMSLLYSSTMQRAWWGQIKQFGTKLFPSLCFQSPPTGTCNTISPNNMDTRLKKPTDRISVVISPEDVGEENTNCPFKCVPSCGVKVRGNGHLKSQPGRGLH